MAIPSRQIGAASGPKALLLWNISKQLEQLIGVVGRNIPVITTTTTTTAAPATYYNVAGCERMEYHVIKYTGTDILTEGTIVNNANPECFYIVDVATGPEDVGVITYVWNTPGDCAPCIADHGFSGIINWGEDSGACYGTDTFFATGDGSTFCNSNNFIGSGFSTVGTGTIVIAYDGQQKVVNVTYGSNVATYSGGCAACPTTTTTTSSTSTSTTTTTTTTAGGTNIYASFSRPQACGQVDGSFMTIYSNSPLGVGVEIFTDPAKTIPYDTNIYGVCIVPIGSNTWYYTSDGMCVTEGNLCTTTEFYSFTGETPVDACSRMNFNVFFYSNLSPLGVGTAIYKDEPLTIPYNPATDGGIYISSEFEGALQLCTMSGNIIQSYTAC